MTHFSQRIAPHVDREIAAARRLDAAGEAGASFAHLERAHVLGQRLDKPEGIAEFAKKNGVEPSRLVDAANSFAVAAKAKQANALATGYGVQGTPSLGVDGRWLTSGSMTGSNEQALAVAEFLIGEARRAVKT